MRIHLSIRRRAAALLTGSVVALVCAVPAAAASQRLGAERPDDPQRVRITHQRPPCAAPADLPIVPNDPGALVTTSGTRCYGTRPPELELWLPLDRYVWLDRQAPMPAAWIDLGGVVVDAATLESPPLGLRLSAADEGWILETRHGDAATLTPLGAGAWTPVRSPDGQRLWVQLNGADEPNGAPRGRVRRAD